MELLRLFDPTTQFQTKSGALNVTGRLRVFIENTDDLANIYGDDGSLLSQPLILDSNGRAPGLFVDSSKVYRLEVQDRYGGLLFTVIDMVPSGGGAGSSLGDKYDVISSDGSISVDRSVDGATTTYDIGLAPNDSDEFLEWIKCSEKDCGATWYPVFQDGSMETEAGKGIKVHGGHLYHFTNSFTVDPDGTGVNYDTFRVAMYCGDDIVDEHDFDIDSSLNDPVLCEFSRDVVPSEDTHVYFKLTIPATCKASGGVQCHRIYSGINAVPDTCATKQWVSGSFQPLSGMSAYVPYSSVGNNSIGQVTGINGSAIAGGFDSASVSSIASSVASAYTESAFASASAGFQPTGDYAYNSALTAYIPASASGAFQPSGDYAFNSAVSSKLDASASGNFVMDSSMTSWIPYSALGYSGTSISGIGGSSLAGIGGGGGGDTGYYVPKSATDVAIGTGVTALYTAFAQGKMCSASSISFAQGSGNTAAQNSLAQGYGNSAVGEGFAQGGGNEAGTHSFAQGLSNKAACGSFAQGISNTAGGDLYSVAQGYSFAQGIFNSAVCTAAVFGSYNLHGNGDTATGDSAAFAIGDGTGYSARHDLMLVTKNGEITMYSSTADSVGLGLVSSIKAISAAATGGVDSATVSAIASSYAESAASGKLDSSASSMFQPSGKYQTAGDYAYNSSVSSKLDASASSQFAPSGNYADKNALSSYVPVSASGQFAPSGDYAYNSALNGKQDSLSFGYSGDYISSINGSSIAGGGGVTGDYVEKSAVPIGIGSSINANNTSIALGSLVTADRMSVAIGRLVSASGTSVAIGARASAGFDSFSFGWYSTANTESVVMGPYSKADHESTTLGYGSYSTKTAVAIGHFLSAGTNNTVFGRYNSTANSANTVFSIGDGNKNARHNLLEIAKDGEITMFSSTADTVGTGIMSSIRAISAAASGDYYSASNPSGFISSLGPITNAELVTALPSSAIAGTLYLIPE